MLRIVDETFPTDVTSSPREIRRPDYPIIALQQLARNALLHRSYERTNAPVKTSWFSDCIEIHKPGGPNGQVTAQNFGQPGVTDYRNPHLAEAMKKLGYIQRVGPGITLARQETKKWQSSARLRSVGHHKHARDRKETSMITVPIIAFFNSKGGIGKTSLVYHQVVADDLDPQANLTEDRLENLWPKGDHPETVSGCVDPLLQAMGDRTQPHLEYREAPFQTPLALGAGDLELARFEDQLSETGLKCLTNDVRALRVTSAFWHTLHATAEIHQAQVVLLDLDPNLGSLNRAALRAADYIVIPLSPDLFSFQGLRTPGANVKSMAF